uniref:Protein phosphatase 1 regulatory subunit 14D n=1 Tax=Malurus cyaneus samueli TaxID=2593467 RepID=A0A8C5UDX3_9PASS
CRASLLPGPVATCNPLPGITNASHLCALPRVTFQTPEKPGEESSHRKLGKLTIKYNRKDLQRWLDLEEWINAQLQELYQCREACTDAIQPALNCRVLHPLRGCSYCSVRVAQPREMYKPRMLLVTDLHVVTLQRTASRLAGLE